MNGNKNYTISGTGSPNARYVTSGDTRWLVCWHKRPNPNATRAMGMLCAQGELSGKRWAQIYGGRHLKHLTMFRRTPSGWLATRYIK